MFNRMVVAFLCLVTAITAAAEPTPKPEPLAEAEGSTIGFATVAEALTALHANAGARFSEQGGWTIVQVGAPGQPDFALWSFAPPSHRAYPAAVKRTVFSQDGQVMVGMQVQCEAAKEPCDDLVREFQQLNERMKEAMRAGHGS